MLAGSGDNKTYNEGMERMKREPGFYWVKMRSTGKWVVSEFLYGGWHLPNYRLVLKDEHFEAIHETRLIPPGDEKDEPIPVHATPEGRLYIKPADLFAKKSVQDLIMRLTTSRKAAKG